MADSSRGALDRAWGQIPSAHGSTSGLGSFTRRRINRAMSLVVALGCLALGLQAFLAALVSDDMTDSWRVPLVIIAFVPLVMMLTACAVGRAVRAFAGTFAVAYVVLLMLWPAAASGATVSDGAEPWIWYLVNVATVSAALAFPLPLQIAWAALVPLLFGIVRVVTARGDLSSVLTVGLDVSFALILGGMLVTLGWLFRAIASHVDETRERAVSSYAEAAAADAAEEERVAVAALMHDSVLAALIAVERARSPRERGLAATMAREALTRLANTESGVEEGADAPWDALHIVAEIDAALVEFGLDVLVEQRIDAHAGTIPGRVARALSLAATQAIANSAQHAGAAGLRVSVQASAAPSRVHIEVSDTGAGFDLDLVPADRLGLRGSVVARVGAVGGIAEIASDSSGTRVRLDWPAEGAP
ncbi:ATP-binding protein [Microbacterium sp. BWT-B31]|uniref:sensor histidine kinase n=1 Tax=Microbacterium sp. BWT-B31 TaxID=3232072 RepID=UPI0035274403